MRPDVKKCRITSLTLGAITISAMTKRGIAIKNRVWTTKSCKKGICTVSPSNKPALADKISSGSQLITISAANRKPIDFGSGLLSPERFRAWSKGPPSIMENSTGLTDSFWFIFDNSEVFAQRSGFPMTEAMPRDPIKYRQPLIKLANRFPLVTSTTSYCP
jgi:hypothetical protein